MIWIMLEALQIYYKQDKVFYKNYINNKLDEN